MLTLPEKIIFVVSVLITIGLALRVIERIYRTILRGHGKIDWRLVPKRLVAVLAKTISLQPTFKIRLLPSLFHALVSWGFMFYLLVNFGDTLDGFIEGFHFPGQGIIANLYHLTADLFSIAVLIGISALIVRRWLIKPANLTARADILLHPKAHQGIRRDSAIVGAFILVHVGSRFLGEVTSIALNNPDPWQPFANLIAASLGRMKIAPLTVVNHIFFWLALGTILLFIPYFLYSKHLHLFLAPLNFLLKPARRSIGELSRLDFEDESIEQFGAMRLEDLGWEQIMDAYACIMCYRCQEVCPAYQTGKVLSPAALEINKRYLLNQEGNRLARGDPSSQTLIEFAIPPEAVWACTACGACVDICPTNNEPMRDILDIRRALVLMENQFPEQLQAAFRGMERYVNPWNVPAVERMKWAEGLIVPTVEELSDPEVLWWVGCAPATEARAQNTARAFTKVLQAAGVRFVVLGQQEQCTGDSARRAGNEYLFNELALANVELLNSVDPPRIVTTCPHCLHTLKNEYPAYGGNYHVVHHSQFINELTNNGRLALKGKDHEKITFHDPCYLGRHNRILSEPRQVIHLANPGTVELPRRGVNSFCCGAGGAQMWKEEEDGNERVNANRIKEVMISGAKRLAVGCPFCMIMLNDAAKTANADLKLMDIAEIVLERLEVK
jgi:Fe-S oxidoreductase